MSDSRGAMRQVWEPWKDPSKTAYVKVDAVTKRFDDFTAVDGVSLDIFKGEFFTLLGPSGCGKTTLLRMLAGFEIPSEGQIMLDGEDMSAVPPYLRPVNMMFQSYALFPHMTVEDNIGFGLKQDRMPKADIKVRVQEMIDLVQLGPFARRKPHQLSGGQRQRVALARSLAKKPKMLLLDEPLGALDKKLREQTQFELMNLQEELGITFVIVTHDQEEAMTVSSRIAVMDHGRIVQVATPTEIYEYPNSRYVAEFIGDVNMFEARFASEENGQVSLHCQEADCTILPAHGVDVAPGASVWVAVRPEKLRISKEPPARTDGNCVSGEVWDIGYMGKESIYHVKLPSGRMVVALEANSVRHAERAITWEDQVYLSWMPHACVVLAS